MLFGYSFRQIVIRLIAVLLAMSFHEMAHGLAAYLLGDRTASRAGRLSLNPLAHIDWLGLLCLLLFGFGWAKPVPIDPGNYRHPKTGIIWTSFAGPLANFLLSFLMLWIAVALGTFAYSFTLSAVGDFLFDVCLQTAVLSLGFGVFNLIPVPPLDGAKIFWAFLPDQEYYRFNRGSIWTYLILLAAIYTGILNTPLNFLVSNIYSFFLQGAYLLCGLG